MSDEKEPGDFCERGQSRMLDFHLRDFLLKSKDSGSHAGASNSLGTGAVLSPPTLGPTFKATSGRGIFFQGTSGLGFPDKTADATPDFTPISFGRLAAGAAGEASASSGENDNSSVQTGYGARFFGLDLQSLGQAHIDSIVGGLRNAYALKVKQEKDETDRQIAKVNDLNDLLVQAKNSGSNGEIQTRFNQVRGELGTLQAQHETGHNQLIQGLNSVKQELQAKREEQRRKNEENLLRVEQVIRESKNLKPADLEKLQRIKTELAQWGQDQDAKLNQTLVEVDRLIVEENERFKKQQEETRRLYRQLQIPGNYLDDRIAANNEQKRRKDNELEFLRRLQPVQDSTSVNPALRESYWGFAPNENKVSSVVAVGNDANLFEVVYVDKVTGASQTEVIARNDLTSRFPTYGKLPHLEIKDQDTGVLRNLSDYRGSLVMSGAPVESSEREGNLMGRMGKLVG
jgi:hypothetical protein